MLSVTTSRRPGVYQRHGRSHLNHYTDRHIGGHGSDVPVLGLLTLAGLYAIYARMQGRKA